MIILWSNDIEKICSRRKFLVVEPFNRKIKLSKCRMWGNLTSKKPKYFFLAQAVWTRQSSRSRLMGELYSWVKFINARWQSNSVFVFTWWVQFSAMVISNCHRHTEHCDVFYQETDQKQKQWRGDSVNQMSTPAPALRILMMGKWQKKAESWDWENQQIVITWWERKIIRWETRFHFQLLASKYFVFRISQIQSTNCKIMIRREK